MNSSSPSKLSEIETKLLEFFFENSGKEFFEKEVRVQSKISAGATNKYLKSLTDKNLLLHRKIGRMNFYKLNKEDELVKQMKKTYTLSLPFMQKIKESAKEINMEIYLYGSCARGEDNEKSDVDLLVIGNIEPKESERFFSPIRKISKKPIKVSLFTKIEWLSMKKKDMAFFERVEKDKIRIV